MFISETDSVLTSTVYSGLAQPANILDHCRKGQRTLTTAFLGASSMRTSIRWNVRNPKTRFAQPGIIKRNNCAGGGGGQREREQRERQRQRKGGEREVEGWGGGEAEIKDTHSKSRHSGFHIYI